MIANYHTHTWRCNHATGTEREYIEAAIGHFKILGFSDHTPQPYPGDFVDHSKMKMDQLEDYVTTVSKLREEYKDDIEIHIGLEVEYYPAYFDELIKFESRFPIEYFILGQHWLGNEIKDVSPFMETDDPKTLERYYYQTAEALETGRFTYFAHPDVMNFVGDEKIYDYWMRKLCKKASELHIPLEINFQGLRSNRNYPNPRFFKIAGEEGCDVIFGSDAHSADVVYDEVSLPKGEKMVKAYGLHLLETVELRNPFTTPSVTTKS
ncbi:MAG: histidinol-phosphatase [Catonella sp.]|jgi:histidinol-phosphatase (PHP family)|nr:histidinol-phosphatase [Catonella sp.]MDY6357226.1 histidinol-phosphatase [Catonella sp.]